MGDGTEDVEGNLNPGPDASRTPSSADKHGGTRSGQNRQGKWEGENPDEGDSVSPATGSANRRGSLDHSDVKDEDTGSDEDVKEDGSNEGSYIGVVQTIISFHEGAKDPLKGFTAGGVRFVVVAEGPLYLVAISSLGESDNQLRVQLGALYMQVLSTLTLPALERIFSDRPSSDLRRPLQGTEPLLSALADSFTKGSPSTLLSALECLKIRKSHRQVINTALLHSRTPDLLYGLIVAGGRLVSVVRPKKHSLHPSDLQLIFNMLFEAGGVKAGGGENWIPLCLPGFNKNGFLYMYVSFLGAYSDDDTPRNLCEGDDQVAILLISANKEGFYELKTMRDDVVQVGIPISRQDPAHDYKQLEKDGSMAIIKAAVRQGPFASRAALAQGANKMAQWVKREEERVFIVGGAVF
ncbi:MAG: Vacuolar fusion protein mon1 [Thelocarpon impressellum]|nr:MAG: Vacuolar fusion protein mon1 [Thelocarpon impressellum]